MTALARTAPRIDLGSMARVAELADYATPLALRAVAALGVADQLVGGSRSVEQIAAATDTHAESLRRVLRALASRGVFAEEEPDVFGLTPLSEVLRSDHPYSIRDACPLVPSEVEAWTEVMWSLRTGTAAFDRVHGCDYYAYLADHPDQRELVDRAMRSINHLHVRAVTSAYPWSDVGTVVDVGGGDGSFLAGLLRRHRELRGIVFDRVETLERARQTIAAAGVDERCEVVGGDFFLGVPAGADAYVLKTVLPGFDDEAALAILSVLAEAATPESRVLILNSVADANAAHDVGRIVDLNALILAGGRDRTVAEIEDLLRRAGLDLIEQRTTVAFPMLVAARRR